MDRRIQKTRDLLHQALASLILEKPYEKIAVKEILDRANVGRSTFYMHFHDKDELLASTFQDILHAIRSAGPPSSAGRHERILWFSLPIFEHVQQHRSRAGIKMGTRGRAIIHEHLRTVLADLIAEEVHKSLQGCGKKASDISPALLAHFIASTFILVLDWWLEDRKELPPQAINDVFRSLVLPALTHISN
jgi:AcrR family transcriptional regulator